MSIPLFTNNAYSALAVSIIPSTTVIQVTAGTGSLFPNPTGTDYFYLTLISISNSEQMEIVKCTSRAGDYLTVLRGQEGTGAQAFNISDNVQLRITAAGLNALITPATTSLPATSVTYVPSGTVTSTNVQGAIDQLATATPTVNASAVTYNEGGTGAVNRTVQSKLQERVSVKDFGAVGDGSHDDTAAIQATIDSLSQAGTGGVVYLPAGTYKVTSNLNITWPNGANQDTPARVTIEGEGADISYIYDYRTSVSSGGCITIDFSAVPGSRFFTPNFGGFSLIKKVNATTYNAGTNVYSLGTGTALYLNTVPDIGTFSDIRIIGYNTGIQCIDCLAMNFTNINISLADLGITAASASFSEPTQFNFTNCTIAGVKSVGCYIIGGGPVRFEGGVFEIVGCMSGSSKSVAAAIYYQNTAFLPTGLIVDGTYFEANQGAADIYIDNLVSVTARAVDNIYNCTFARSSATLYTTNNIYIANNSGTATNIVNTVGNGFKGFSPYTASSSRLYIADGGTNTGGITIYGLGNFYDNPTETPTAVTNVTGGGSGSQNLQSVTTLGNTTSTTILAGGTYGVKIGNIVGSVPFVQTASSSLGLAVTGGSSSIILDSANEFRATVANTMYLGSSSYPWNNTYSTTYTVGTSGANITASGGNLVLNGVASAVAGTGLAPVTTNTYYLGGSSLTWHGLYLGNGNLTWNGYAIPAPGGGTTTFLRNDGTWASLSGSGTVTSITAGSGLSGGTITTSGTISLDTTSGNSWTGVQAFTNGITIGSSAFALADGGGYLNLCNTFTVVPSTGVAPKVDNSYVLGSPSFRWSTVYAGTGTINTSDANQKQDINPLTDAEKRVAIRLKNLIRTYKFKDAVAKKGGSARIHVGILAQDVSEAFAAEGLTPANYGIFCSDVLEDHSTQLGVRYDELFAFIIAAL